MKKLSVKFEKLFLPAVTTLAAALLFFFLASGSSEIKGELEKVPASVISAGHDAELVEQNQTAGLLRFSLREESTRSKTSLQRETPECFSGEISLPVDENTGIETDFTSGNVVIAHLALTSPIRAGPVQL